MKKLFCTALFGLFLGGISAQTPQIAEPDFIGEVVTILPDGSSSKLEKETVLLRTRANASAQIFGIGKAKTKLIIDTPEAAVRLKGDDDIRFIVKAVDNATDPISIINVFRFETNKKKRLAELSSVSSFGSVKANKLERLRFSAEKYGEKSYLLTLIDKPAGEYGITVSNPNSLDEKGTIVSTFAIE
ncbi:hypothetical protein [Alistipes timonensis]|jgi:hypothetical protein|uniref:Uncharacterized protein n=1 Tax=Alistipes timonensis JC136 TaxID=1033731 RepID=A0A1H3ZNR8_9BACT|nr:hypothetical protein [Alistipes timonensis]MCR2030567.1 hypothetical protein [Alistipes timonensis]SEA25383.1 hypothetical protein SAMN05444145_102285 [Alistipes timonensis JC136]